MTIAALLPALIPALGKVIDRVLPDKEAQAQARAELARMGQEGELRQTEVQISAILAEANSRDKWTSRARPTFLYVMYGVILLTIVGGIIGIWFPDQVTTAAQNIANLLAAIPESLWWLFGTGYLGYTGARSVDKWKAPN
ncbi:MAG: hypothetical protein HOB82_05730 [Alphaproteobacteria bacterium]|jgi:hypothetical protein|nr:hypothetical protein [Rhodospirillaceae bacterium]MBT4711009.1 hypothetical protein [Alphaproteobacteria bacterium]MBT5859949.1 hypothetical protein [Alphaproteobacteria bacterium]